MCFCLNRDSICILAQTKTEVEPSHASKMINKCYEFCCVEADETENKNATLEKKSETKDAAEAGRATGGRTKIQEQQKQKWMLV